ncbi:hypothetical protein [Nocardioides pantholopis]|uniref:hypothetical protein n=1 Tax=Nocardioides pantholopis TaxID=2483798 RepID=UPI000F08C355|nr:hypothetical protein [Nocardioides pantholopis]
MPTLRLLLAASAVTVVAVAVGVAVLVDPGEDEGPVAVPSIPLAEFDTTGLAVRRDGFCDRVDPDRVVEAVGGDPVDELSWTPGDQGPPGVDDIVHEYGCSWTGPNARTATAWVFAPPVTAKRAAQLSRSAARARGCTPVAGAPAYGAESSALVCTSEAQSVVSFRGLFGDAWLVCSLGEPPTADPVAVADLEDRAGRWCVAVASAAAAD